MSSWWLTATSYPSSTLLRFVLPCTSGAEYMNGALFHFVLTCIFVFLFCFVLPRQSKTGFLEFKSLAHFCLWQPSPKFEICGCYSQMFLGGSHKVSESLALIPPSSQLLFSSLNRHSLKTSYVKATWGNILIIAGVSLSRLGDGVWNLQGLKCELGKFPDGGPVVGTQHFCWGGLGSIPGWATKIL